jgi:hypothetical protein
MGQTMLVLSQHHNQDDPDDNLVNDLIDLLAQPNSQAKTLELYEKIYAKFHSPDQNPDFDIFLEIDEIFSPKAYDLITYQRNLENLAQDPTVKNNSFMQEINNKLLSLANKTIYQHKVFDYFKQIYNNKLNINNEAQWQQLFTLISSPENIDGELGNILGYFLKLLSNEDIIKFMDKLQNKISQQKDIPPNIIPTLINTIKEISYNMGSKGPDYLQFIANQLINNKTGTVPNNEQCKQLFTLLLSAKYIDNSFYNTLGMILNNLPKKDVLSFMDKLQDQISHQKNIPSNIIRILICLIDETDSKIQAKKIDYCKFIINQLINKKAIITLQEIFMIASYFPLKDCRNILPKTTQAKVWLEKITLIQAAKTLGLTWSINHETQFYNYLFPVEGSNKNFQQNFFHEMVDLLTKSTAYISKLGSIETPELNLQDKKSILEAAHETILNQSTKEISQNITHQTSDNA